MSADAKCLDRLTDRVCVVTGAASSLAQSVVDRLTSEGATVVGVDRREHAVGAHSGQADLTDEDQVRALFAINTASFLAVMGAASSQMAYSVAKAGVVQLSRDLGVHLARRGVRVNALILGPIETPQLHALFEDIGDDEIARRFVHYPMGRFGTPEELAGTVAYLASDDAGFITGAAFPLDGGITSAFAVPS
jgi:NAD(P)-dependent dehydrogenase (short-subunit alcohol dehydrogenase family)